MKSIPILAFMFCVETMLVAQGKVGINTTSPLAGLHLKDSSALFQGPSPLPMSPGSTPVSGAGTRLMWYPQKAAMRVGRVTGAQWDRDSIGIHSFSAGFDTKSKGEYSSAFGWRSETSGRYSFAAGFEAFARGESSIALGNESIARGNYSVALGDMSETIGNRSTVMGSFTTAKGFASTSTGFHTQANGTSSFVIGLYNDTIVAPEPNSFSINPLTPLLIVGNGDSGVRSNALIVRKDGNVGIGTNNPTARLHVQDKAVLFKGLSNLPGLPDDPPATGVGIRMMWYPDKAAFRAGRVTSTAWDKDSIGDYSVAIGSNVKAKGTGSVAFGQSNQATGSGAVALGSNTRAYGTFATALGGGSVASGNHSLAMGTASMSYGDYSVALGDHVEANNRSFAAGYYSKAEGYASVAFGNTTVASGSSSLAAGFYTQAGGNISSAFGFKSIANGHSSTVIGLYNDSIVAPQTMITSATPLFIIGNGDNDTTRSNALMVRKDGMIGIGTNNPDDLVHIYKGDSGGAANSAATLVVEDNSSVAINLLTPNANSSALYFGNASSNAHGGIVYNSTTSNGLAFRTNGNSTKMVITDVGSVGIGTTAPDRKLEIAGSGRQGARISSSGSESVALEFIRSGTDWRLIDSSGILYFGRSTDDLVTVTESVRISGPDFEPAVDNSSKLGGASRRWSEVFAVNGTINTSDRRDKKSITDLSSGLSRVLQLRPVSFEWKNAQIDQGRKHIGFLAQDLLEVIPEVVVTHEWETDPETETRSWVPVERLGVNYAEIIPVLTKAIQEQQVLIDQQLRMIQDLEKKLKLIEAVNQ